MRYHCILLCNTCLGSIYEHKVYSKITLCKSKLCCCGVRVRVFLFLSFFVEINGFTILNVEHSGHYINVGLFLVCTQLWV